MCPQTQTQTQPTVEQRLEALEMLVTQMINGTLVVVDARENGEEDAEALRPFHTVKGES